MKQIILVLSLVVGLALVGGANTAPATAAPAVAAQSSCGSCMQAAIAISEIEYDLCMSDVGDHGYCDMMGRIWACIFIATSGTCNGCNDAIAIVCNP